MPIQFFTNAERERLNRFPTEVQYQDLVTFFTLSETDKAQIPVYSAIHNRLGFALQICTLRFMGFVPDDFQSIPPAVVEYVARQLDTIPDDLAEYGTRDQTRTEHLQKIMDYLGYRKINSKDLGMLSDWLTERALEHGVFCIKPPKGIFHGFHDQNRNEQGILLACSNLCLCGYCYI